MNRLVESQWCPIPDLVREEAQALEALGRELSASDDETGEDTSLIQCRYTTKGQWEVRVAEAVGLIGVGERSWPVMPKIPEAHLLHLLQRADVLPAVSTLSASMASGRSFWDLLFDWFLGQTEALLRRDLHKGYRVLTERLPYLRGTVGVLDLSRGLLQGRTRVDCTHEEFTADVALNRVIKTALHHGLTSGTLPPEQARRTRRLLARFTEVSTADGADLRVTTDRSTARYRDALRLAKLILARRHLTLSIGETRVWCFLWRTPDAVEAGVRRTLHDGLGQLGPVTKTRRNYPPLSFTPDLSVADRAVGDVKYSMDQGTWRRSDVYQLLAFAKAFERDAGLLVNFSSEEVSPQSVAVATTRLHKVSWPLTLSPEEAGNSVIQAVSDWLSSLPGE